MATPEQNPTQKGPQQMAFIEVKILLNKITREITIVGPIEDEIFVKGLFHSALRVYDENRRNQIVKPPLSV